MPITLKLSKTFYDRFGDDLVNELVGMLNQVDAASQGSLREMNELNFARFESQLDERTASLDAKIDMLDAKLDAKIGMLDAKIDAKIDMLDAKIDAKIDVVDAKFGERIAELRADLSGQLVVQMRWMIGMWLTVLLAIGGLWFRR